MSSTEPPRPPEQLQLAGISEIFRPPLTYYGGKYSMIRHLLEHCPHKIERYYEPFVGGGALFLALQDRIGKAFLYDGDPAIIAFWEAVRDQVEGLIAAIWDFQLQYQAWEGESVDFGRRLRDDYNAGALEGLQRTAAYVILRKMAFSGMAEYSRSKKPDKREDMYVNPRKGFEREWCFRLFDRLRRSRQALEKTEAEIALQVLGEAKTLSPLMEDEAGPADLVYFDPPYYDTYLTFYKNVGSFQDSKGHEGLRSWAKSLRESGGAKVIISYNDHPFIRELYKAERIYSVGISGFSKGPIHEGYKERRELIIVL